MVKLNYFCGLNIIAQNEEVDSESEKSISSISLLSLRLLLSKLSSLSLSPSADLVSLSVKRLARELASHILALERWRLLKSSLKVSSVNSSTLLEVLLTSVASTLVSSDG